jgi:hypothetical protein
MGYQLINSSPHVKRLVFVAHLKNKMRFTYRNLKFKIQLNCTDGITLPQYGIYKKQNTGTKLNKSISFAHSIIPKNAFNSPNDHENFAVPMDAEDSSPPFFY